MSLSNVTGPSVSEFYGSSFGVSFPDQRNIFTCGSIVSGIVDVSPEKCRSNGIAEITVKVRGVQVRYIVTFLGPAMDGCDLKRLKFTPDALERSQVSSYRQGRKYQVVNVYGESSTIWSSDSLSTQIHALDTISIPFKFVIPSAADQVSVGKFLPPSFRGGTWPLGFEKAPGNTMNKGDAVAKITYFIKVTGSKPKLLKKNERSTLPFVYMPPSVAFRSDIPLPLELPLTKLWMDPADPLGAPPDRWKTYEVVETLRQNMFSNKGRLHIQFSLPFVAGFPARTVIPYQFLIKTYTRCNPGETSAPESLFASDLSGLQMTMYRKIWTQVRRMHETISQTVTRLIENVEPSSVACWEPSRNEIDGADWWVHKAVHVGQFVLDVGPGFQAGPWNLACSYDLQMHLPVKGLRNTVDTTLIQNFVVSSTEVREGTKRSDGTNLTSNEANQLFPPDYWDVVEGDNGFESADKKGW